jgi:nicotinamidase-related amidase
METTRYQERLTPDNAALLLIDHQVGLFTGVRDIPVAELKHNVVGLAKAAQVLGVPIIVTATSPEMWGPVIPELTAALPGTSIINRTTVNTFDEPRFAKAVEATGRKKLIIAGVSTEVCLALPAIHAAAVGYDAYGVIDASGTFSETKRITGLLRMVQAGVIVTDYATVAVEMLKDNASPKAGALYAALDMPFAGLVGQLAGAFAKGRAAWIGLSDLGREFPDIGFGEPPFLRQRSITDDPVWPEVHDLNLHPVGAWLERVAGVYAKRRSPRDTAGLAIYFYFGQFANLATSSQTDLPVRFVGASNEFV